MKPRWQENETHVCEFSDYWILVGVSLTEITDEFDCAKYAQVGVACLRLVSPRLKSKSKSQVVYVRCASVYELQRIRVFMRKYVISSQHVCVFVRA
jgi:hypothetical protein